MDSCVRTDVNGAGRLVKKNDSIATKRSCSLQALAVYLNEDLEKLVKEYGNETPDETQAALDQTVISIYVIKHPGADVDQPPEDVGIVVEGVEVIDELKDVDIAFALLFGIIYDLNLSLSNRPQIYV